VENNTTYHLATGTKEAGPGLPPSNVLQFVLEDGSLVSIRPSGTEPKVKFYASCNHKSGSLEKDKRVVEDKIKAISENLDSLLN